MSMDQNLNNRTWTIIEEQKLGDINFLETLVYEWIRRSIAYPKFCLSNAIIQSIGLQFKSILKIKPYEFEADLDWVSRFRQTFNISEVSRKMRNDIGYKKKKSINLEEIYNDLKPQWEALDPEYTFAVEIMETKDEIKEECMDFKDVEDTPSSSEIIEIKDEIKEECMDVEDVEDTPSSSDSALDLDKILEDIRSDEGKDKKDETSQNEVLDFEEELPVSTIFGRHLSKLLVSKVTETNVDRFQPMVLFTDPKNAKSNAIEEREKQNKITSPMSTEDKSISPNMTTQVDEVSINDKMDYGLLTSNQNKFLGKFLKDPKPTQIFYPIPSAPAHTSLLEQETYITPNSTATKLRQLKPKLTTIQNSPDSAVLSSLSDKSSKKKPTSKPKAKLSSKESKNTKNSPTATVNQTPANFEISMKPPVPINCRTVSKGKTSKIQPTCSSNSRTNLSKTNLQDITQPTLISPTLCPLKAAKPDPDHNTNIIPIITPPTIANLQPTMLVKPTTMTESNALFPQPNASFVQTNDSCLQPTTLTEPNALFPQPNASFVQTNELCLQPNPSFLQPLTSFVQSTSPGQPTTSQPIILHFHPSMPIQTTTNFLTQEKLPTMVKDASTATSTSTSVVSEQNPTNQKTPFENSFLPQPQIIPTTPIITPTTVQNSNSSRYNIPPGKGTRFAQRQPLKTQEEVVKCIKLMEDFAMLKENFRLIGFLERLEKHVNVIKK